MDVLFDMVECDVDGGVVGSDPIGDALREKDGAVLASSAAEREHQMGEMAFQVVVDALADQPLHMLKKQVGLGLFFQVFNHFPVTAGLGLELRLSSWVGEGTAVEHKAASVATEVVGIALLEREAVDGDGKLSVER